MFSEPRESRAGASEARPGAAYFAILAAAAVLSLGLIAAFNFVLDPYAVWRNEWPAINEHRRWLHTDDAPLVTVLFHRPSGLILGNSLVAMGVDPHGPGVAAWGGVMPVAHPTSHYDFESQVLDAASRSGRLKVALVEIDERQLSACQWTKGPVEPVAAAVRLLSLPALRQSAGVLAMNLAADAAGPPTIEHQLASGLVVRQTRLPSATQMRRFDFPATIFGAGIDAACADRADRRLEALASLAHRRRFELVFFLPPWRAALLQQALADGDWPRLEALKRRLAAVAGHTGAPVWDFSTAALRPASGVTDRDFYDAFHFRPPLGERLLMAMRPGARDQSALAIRLTPANVNAAIAADREAIARLGPGPFAAPAPPSAGAFQSLPDGGAPR